MRGPAAGLGDALRACLHADIPAELVDAQVRWRERRERFEAAWSFAVGALRDAEAVAERLPFGEWGAFERGAFRDDFPGLIPSVEPDEWSMGRYSDHFLACLRRDEFFRPAAVEAYQHHRKKLFWRETARFDPTGPPGFELILSPDHVPHRAELVVSPDAEGAGRVKLGIDGWRPPRPAVAVLCQGHSPAARGAFERITLVTDRPVSAPVRRRLFASCAHPSVVVDPPDGALARRDTFRTLEQPLLAERIVETGAPRTLRHRGKSYEARAGAYWRIGEDEPRSNFVLLPVRCVRRPDGSLLHELELRLADGAGEVRFTVASSDFHHSDRLYVAAWEAAIGAGLEAPVVPDGADRRLLPALVLALHEPAPLVDERPAVIDRFLALKPPVYEQRGRRLVDLSFFERGDGNDDPVDALNLQELLTALRRTYGPEFGLVRVGKHKTNRAVRIP